MIARAFANASSFVGAKTGPGRVRKGRPGPGYICTRQPGPYLTAVKVYPRYSISFAPVSDIASRAHFDECYHADVRPVGVCNPKFSAASIGQSCGTLGAAIGSASPVNGQSGTHPFRQR